MIPPHPPPPQYRLVNKVNQFQQQQQHYEKATQISAITDGRSIMGERNEQAYLRSRNNNCQVKNVFSKRRIGRATAIYEPDPNNYANNEADTNVDTCCLGMNFIQIAYTNFTADVYPYSNSCDPLENVPIVSGATEYDHPNGNTYIFIYYALLYYGKQMNYSLIKPNHI